MMYHHAHALEAFNRATFDPPTPELCAAEELQPTDRMTPREIIRSIPSQDVICGAAAAFGFVLFFAAVSVVAS